MSENIGETASHSDSNSTPPKPQESKYSKAKRAVCKYCQESTRHLGNPKTLIPNLTFLAVAIYTALTGFQLKIAQESLTDSQRAFMFPDTFWTYTWIKPDRVGMQILWKNSGNTPTRNLTVWIVTTNLQRKLDSSFSFPDNIPAKPNDKSLWVRSFVGPQADFSSQIVAVAYNPKSPIDSGHQYIYFWGWARYNDIFDSKTVHLTRFCEEIYAIIPDPKNIALPTAYARQCNYGNCADDECRAEGIPPPS